MDTRIKDFLKKAKQWKAEMELLRNIIMECDVEEDFKWQHPCYTHAGKNIVLIHNFKAYCAVLFHKGALIDDTEDILSQQTAHSQVTRQARFTNVDQIRSHQATLKAYIKEAIINEKEGKEVPLKKTSDYDKPNELAAAFEEDPEFEKAFNALTPGRQRGYLLHFSDAKQSKTRVSRIEKAKLKIHDGKGHNER